jgi:hypothetical protein
MYENILISTDAIAKTGDCLVAKKAVGKPKAGSPPPKNPKSSKTAGLSAGTRESPWILKTPPGTSEYTAFRDEDVNPAALVIQVGKIELRYQLRYLADLHAMLNAHGESELVAEGQA